MPFQNVPQLRMNMQRKETRKDSWVRGLEMYLCKSHVFYEVDLPGVSLPGRILEKHGDQTCAPCLGEGRGGETTVLRDGSLATSLHL